MGTWINTVPVVNGAWNYMCCITSQTISLYVRGFTVTAVIFTCSNSFTFSQHSLYIFYLYSRACFSSIKIWFSTNAVLVWHHEKQSVSEAAAVTAHDPSRSTGYSNAWSTERKLRFAVIAWLIWKKKWESNPVRSQKGSQTMQDNLFLFLTRGVVIHVKIAWMKVISVCTFH